jgi:probable F420-dependent oxidoreductase
MKIGVSGNIGQFGPYVPALAGFIEQAGFESVWTGEHIVIPRDMASLERHGVPMPEGYKHMPDMFLTLAMAAAGSKSLKLGTAVCLLPQHEPLSLAKQVASLDVFSGGRVIFGIGNGWIEEEAGIFGYPYDRRVRVANECLDALKVIWSEDAPSFSGEFVSFPPVYSYPKPHQQPHPPILIGSGDSTTDNSRILKRVAKIADGWIPINLSPAEVKRDLALLRTICKEDGRDFDVLDITVYVPAASFGLDEVSAPIGGARASGPAAELIAAYQEAGVGRLAVVLWDAEDADAFRRMVESAASALGLA